jgi:hypothetical protein
MPEIPDLSKLKNGSTPPEPEAPQQQEVRTAFLVLVDANGNIQVSTDVGENIVPDHMASHDEIWSACQLIIKDIQIQQTAGLVSNGLLQMGSALQQHAQEQALRARLNLK